MLQEVVKVARDFGGLRVDTLSWPIILLDCPEDRLPDSELDGALGWIEEILRGLKAGDKCAQVTDLSRVRRTPPASQRQLAGRWLTRNAELLARTSVGGGAVTPSPILRGIVTAIYWFHKPATSIEFFATRPQALRYALRLLEQAKIPLGPRVLELRDEIGRDSADDTNALSSFLSRWRGHR
jgi:hypothetical protein